MNLSRAFTFATLAYAVGSVIIPELGFAGQTDISRGIGKINTEAQGTMGNIVDIGLMLFGVGVGVGGGHLMQSKAGGLAVGSGIALGAPALRQWMYAGTAAGGASIEALFRMVGL